MKKYLVEFPGNPTDPISAAGFWKELEPGSTVVTREQVEAAIAHLGFGVNDALDELFGE